MHDQEVHSDLTVVGGGLAGVAAAISAARLGLSVALIGNRPVLGGNSSSEVRVWVCGATAHGLQRYARETGVIGELYVENQFRNPEGNPIHWDEVVLDAVRAESGIRLFLNTDVREVEADGEGGDRRIRSVTGWTMGSEITTVFRSPLFVDATGDGLIGHLAGADYRIGREARHEFDEPWGLDEPTSQLLGSTILFYTKDTGRPVRFVPPDSTKDIRTTPIPMSRIIRSGDSGAHYWWIEWGGELDTVRDNERIRDELKSVIFGIWDHIKNSGEFASDTLDLEWVGNVPGKREYRRFLGDHVLTQNDVLGQVSFPDAVGFGGWSIDLHPVEGMYAKEAGAIQRYSDGVYEIPLRSLYSRNVGNLFVAGRDISATHVAFGSTRVMATCAVTGEAVGTAATIALAESATPRTVSREHAESVRQLLLRQDASLIGVRNADPEDLARTGLVRASSELSSLDPADVDPASATSAEEWALDTDIAVLLPVDPRLDGVRALMHAADDVDLEVSLWTTGLPQNFVPIDESRRVTVRVSASDRPRWVDVPLTWHPEAPENVVIVFHRADAARLVMHRSQVPGTLTMRHLPEADGDANVSVDHSDALIAWPAHPTRGWSPRIDVRPPTSAMDAAKAVGGYHRPYGGPQLWCSAATDFSEPEWLEVALRAPARIAEIRLVFDDDVDVELNTLHHHRSPHLVMPGLVRDYRIALLVDGRWTEVAAVGDNRRRQRVHRLPAGDAATAVRVTVTATNGAPQARIVSLRVYGL